MAERGPKKYRKYEREREKYRRYQEERQEEKEEWGDAKDDPMMQEQPSFSTPKRSSTATRFQQQRQPPTLPEETNDNIIFSVKFKKFFGTPKKKVNSPELFERVRFEQGTTNEYLALDDVAIKNTRIGAESLHNLTEVRKKNRQFGIGKVQEKQAEFKLCGIMLLKW